MRVLLIEDDGRIAAQVQQALGRHGYLVEVIGEGEEGQFLTETEDYDAVIIDLGLPDMDGLSVIKNVRRSGVTTPILALTARSTWRERVAGIDAGADDYLPKPFQLEELAARLSAIVRRSAGRTTPLISLGNVVVDTRRMSVLVDGSPIALSMLEYRTLRYLLHKAGRVVSQEELAEHVYAREAAPGSNAIEVLIGRLRRKIGSTMITTRRGYGYIVEPEP